MITLQMEFQKIKRKKIALTMGALICVQFAWLLWSGSHPDENGRLQGWIEMLHSLPLVSVIMMPTPAGECYHDANHYVRARLPPCGRGAQGQYL